MKFDRYWHPLQFFSEGGEAPAPEAAEAAPGSEDTGQNRQEAFARQQLEQWHQQAQRAREVYPGLDLAAEARDPRFRQLLRTGLDVESAYTLVHRDRILTAAMGHAARVARQQLSSAIRSGCVRPAENGIQSGTAVTVQDVAHLSRSQRNDIRKRAARGEKVRF